MVTTIRYTYDDLLNMPEDDGNRYEIIDGELIVSAAPSRIHQATQRRLGRLLDAASDNERLGCVYFAPVDVHFTESDVVEPDLVFIRRERLDLYHQRGVLEAPPDIAVEIISPSSRRRDERTKADLFARFGVPEYWLADPERRTLKIFALVDGRYLEIEPENGIIRSRVLPHLTVDVAELFRGIESA